MNSSLGTKEELFKSHSSLHQSVLSQLFQEQKLS